MFQAACETAGGGLAEISSPEENVFVSDLLNRARGGMIIKILVTVIVNSNIILDTIIINVNIITMVYSPADNMSVFLHFLFFARTLNPAMLFCSLLFNKGT